MPSKPAAKPSPGTDMLDPLGLPNGSQSPAADPFGDPLAQLVESDASAVETPPAEAPAPPLFEPATDDPDDEDDDEEEAPPQSQATAPPKTSRRGFLGAAAAMVGASAVAAAAPAAAPAVAEPAVQGMTPDMAAMASFFHQLMDERDRKQQEDLDRRFAALKAEL